MLSLSNKATGLLSKSSPLAGRVQPVRSYTRVSTKPINKPVFGLKASIAAFTSSHLRSGYYKTPSITSLPEASSKHVRFHGSSAASSDPNAELATVNWVLKNGEVKSITEKVGMNLLEIAHKHGIELEGACEGSIACSTCHVIFEDQDEFEISGEITDEENDMLDLAFGLTQTSRLGCQVILSKDLDGMRVRLPNATRNMMVDGHVPKPH